MASAFTLAHCARCNATELNKHSMQTGSKGRIPLIHIVIDAGKGKVLAYTGVPADMAKTMPAGNWLKVALDVLGGKGGGKPTNAQGQGPHIDKLPEAMSAAKAHADSILS